MENYYHVFKKQRKISGKLLHHWYYYFYNADGNRIQRVCKDCKSRREAEDFIRTLPDLNIKKNKIKNIACGMYLPNSEHILRREALGKRITMHTLSESRIYIKLIIEQFAEYTIEELDDKKVYEYLFSQNKSGSWKNRFLEVLKEVYIEAHWYGSKVIIPQFNRFARNTKKKSVFTYDEIKQLLLPVNFDMYDFFLFYSITFFCGLRLGEARAIQQNQIDFDRKLLIVNGFIDVNMQKTRWNKKGSETNQKVRVTFIPEQLLACLKEHIEHRVIPNESFIFSPDGVRPYRAEYLRTIFNRAVDRAGINRQERILTPHSLRFTFVTQMLQAVDAGMVSRMVGHTNLSMTEYYNQPGIEESYQTIASARGAADSILNF